ncbi:unnamed protein product [Rotaria sp. Silwood1]|nr:unnamed protein product [Rotaria sp. Silwood1]
MTNNLISDLISLLSNKIEIGADEILRDTYEQPNEKSFVYSVLFDDWSRELGLRQIVIDQLFARLVQWEDRGLKVGELSRWKNYSENEHTVACRIWNYISQVTAKNVDINNLVKAEEDQMQKKATIKDTITMCLLIYCPNAVDLQTYLQQLEDMDKRFQSDIIRSIDVPPEIDVLSKYTSRLISYSESELWLNFYRQHRKSMLSTTNSDPEPIERQKTFATTETYLIDSETTETVNQQTCADLLMEADRIFDIFREEVNSICKQWHEFPISQLVQLFPDSNYVDDDLRMLEPLLNDQNIVHIVKGILDYWKSYSHIRNICSGGIRFLNHISVLPNDLAPTLTSMLETTKDTPGKCWLKACQNFHKAYPQYNTSPSFFLIAQYGLSNELIDFVHRLSVNDVNALREVVNDWDESLVSTKTILDFALIKTFLDRIYAQAQSSREENSTTHFGFDEVIHCFEIVLNEIEFQNIQQCFEICSKSLLSIQRIHQDIADREQSKRQRIIGIMKQSSLYFVYQSIMLYDSIEHQFDVNIDDQSMVFGELIELHDRARLIEYSNNKMTNNSEEELDLLRSFIGFVDLIEEILKRFLSLHVSGHLFVSEYLSSPEKFTCTEKNYQQLINFSVKLDGYLNEWDDYVCMMYERCIDLTYFSFQQVWMVERYLRNLNTASKTDTGYHLLRYIGIDPKLLKIDESLCANTDPFKRLETIGKILSKYRSSRDSVLPGDMSVGKKVRIAETSEEGVMRAILSFSKSANIPATASQLFYCTEKTSWIEIRAFIYRCFFSKTLQVLIRPERLESLIQDQFLQLFRTLMKKHSNLCFQLGIIATVSTTQLQLVQGLKTLDIVQLVHDQDMLSSTELSNTVKRYTGNDVTLVMSPITGLGKSSFISDAIKNAGRQHVKFPIHGNINVDVLAERLCKYATQFVDLKLSAALHIDIGAVDNIRQLHEIIYCLLLFRSFRFGQVAVHVPNNVPIYIELDASFHLIPEQEKLIILNSLHRENIDQIDWKKLNLEKMPGISLVANYLQSIKNSTIILQDLNEQNMKPIDLDTCSSLLEQYFVRDKDGKNIAWTKLFIFIAVYSHLFSGFSRCGYFLVSSVKWLNVPQLRMDILISLLNSSDQFTSLSVENVRQNQRSTNTSNLVDFSESIIRWDKSQPFTLVFTATDDPVFVYKKADDVPKSLVQAFNVRPRSRLQQQTSLSALVPDYTTLTHEQFFAKLASLSRKYFNKSICLRCFSQHEYGDQQCKKCSTKDPLAAEKHH